MFLELQIPKHALKYPKIPCNLDGNRNKDKELY